MDAVPLPVRVLEDVDGEGEEVAMRARSSPDAFAELYVLHREPVFRYLRARCSNEDDALEVTAITFERAFSARARYEPRGGGVLAWLLRIARNAAIDQARSRKRRPSHPLAASAVGITAGSPEDTVVADEERRELLHSIAQLPEPQRDAIALRYGAGLTSREIGLVIGKGEEATQKLITRALARLREDLK